MCLLFLLPHRQSNCRPKPRIFRHAQYGFDAKVLAYDPYAPAKAFSDAGMECCEDLKELCRRSDFINVSIPLTDSTRNLIGEEELRLCKPTAVVVNTARGGIVDETALYRALKEGRIYGAGCDVFCEEPPQRANIPLFELPNFMGTSHIGGTSTEALQRCAVTVVEEVFSVLDGKEPRYCVV